MSRNGRIVTGVIALVVVVGVAVGVYLWFSGGSGEASQPIAAPTIDPVTLNKPTATTASVAAATVEATESVVSAVTEAASAPTEAATTVAAAPASSGVLFNIVSDKSTVSFQTHETLRGEPTDVLGTTNQVAGQLYVNFDHPAQSQVGVIRTDVRTLKTPEEFRDRAIRGQILQSSQDKYEYVDFTPTSLEGLPATITIGQPVTFRIVGDLKIRDITQSVTFDATVTPTSKTELSGSATAKVTRTQYQLVIPSVPFVADVSDDVTLKIDFVAQAAS
jgi:polyisoprenoid-binding protein YceI